MVQVLTMSWKRYNEQDMYKVLYIYKYIYDCRALNL